MRRGSPRRRTGATERVWLGERRVSGAGFVTVDGRSAPRCGHAVADVLWAFDEDAVTPLRVAASSRARTVPPRPSGSAASSCAESARSCCESEPDRTTVSS